MIYDYSSVRDIGSVPSQRKTCEIITNRTRCPAVTNPDPWSFRDFCSRRGHMDSVSGVWAGRFARIPISIIVVNSESEVAQIAGQLKAGADFASLARAKSTDPTANDAGYMGMIDPAKLRPELRDALHGVAPGQITGIARIPSGYAILKVLNEPPGARPD